MLVSFFTLLSEWLPWTLLCIVTELGNRLPSELVACGPGFKWWCKTPKVSSFTAYFLYSTSALCVYILYDQWKHEGHCQKYMHMHRDETAIIFLLAIGEQNPWSCGSLFGWCLVNLLELILFVCLFQQPIWVPKGPIRFPLACLYWARGQCLW